VVTLQLLTNFVAGKKRNGAMVPLLLAFTSIFSHAQGQSSANQDSPTEEVRVCCRPLPKWSGAKDWFQLGLNRLVVEHLHHCYIELGESGEGSGTGVYGKTSSIHPVAPYNANKQPMPDQLTDSLTMGGACKKVADATPEKVSLLKEELAEGVCPSCGPNYHTRMLSAFFNNCNTYVFELLRAAGMTPPKMSGVPGYRAGRAPRDSEISVPRTREPEAKQEKAFRGSHALSEFARRADANLLLYFNNENDFTLVKRGQEIPLELKTHLWSPGTCCAHRATPAFSHHGASISFVRLDSTQPRREVVSILDVETQAVKDVFFASMIWGISWSADDSRLAVIADTDAPGQHTLNLIDLPSGNVSKLVSGSVSLDGARYSLSDYAPVAWSGDGTRLAIEFRRAGPGANNGNAGAIVVWDLTTGTFRKLSNGVEPSWSPSENDVVFIDGARKKCLVVNADGGTPKLLFSSTTGPLPAGRSPLVFPVIWSPDGRNLIFHEWVDADLAVNVFRLELSSGKIERIGKSEMQVVAWR
jgi:hypothetical protein